MGIPKYYRWISERYPCLSQIVREHEVRARPAGVAVGWLGVVLNAAAGCTSGARV
jgi:5'-3' exonuclease